MAAKGKGSKPVARAKQVPSKAKLSVRTANGKIARRPIPGTFTVEKRRRFLELYAAGGPVRRHAEAIDISPSAIFRTARLDPGFADELAVARETNTDHVEDDIHTLACGGNLTAMFGILRARRPNVWRENVAVRHDVGDGFAMAFAAAMQSIKEGAPLGVASATDRPGQPVH